MSKDTPQVLDIWKDENGIYKIEFCQSDCEYNLYNSEGNFIYQLTKSMARYMEVIGNIHNNADLIKVGGK